LLPSRRFVRAPANPKSAIQNPKSLRLQNTEIKGHRYLTTKTQAVDDQKKRAEAFLEKLKSAQKKTGQT